MGLGVQREVFTCSERRLFGGHLDGCSMGNRCLRGLVVSSVRCEKFNSRCLVLRSTPAITKLLANVCRRSWNLNALTRAASRTPVHALRI
jgi:hypothetical protein